VTERTQAELERDNSYLKARLAQLQNDITDLKAENRRLAEERERLHGRSVARAPDPLSGGQS
jgi:predicted  nucleic acid-binding Zn-ribbon protein